MDFSELKNKFLSAVGKTTDATRDFAGKAADSTKDFAGKAADKVKAGGRIAKLNIEIAQEKDNVKKTYVEIGKLYYDTHKDDPDGFFIQLCEEVAAAEKAIADKEAEIASLKEGFSSKEEPDIDVEFEEVVAEGEAAAEDAAEGVAEEVSDVVEEVTETVENAAEEAGETVEEILEAVEDVVKPDEE